MTTSRLPPDPFVDLADPPPALGTASRRTIFLLPAFLVPIAGIVLALFEGGNPRATWYAVALFLLALFVLVLLVAPPAESDRSRIFDLAVVAFGLYTLWAFVSILWADVPGDAWEGANRALLYWMAFTLVGLRAWPASTARIVVGLIAFGLAALAAGLLIVATASDDVAKFFLEGRLSEPIGYANATSNLLLIAFFPSVHLAIAREGRWYLRGISLGAATLLLQVALLAQSRGAVLAFIVVGVVFVVLHPRSWAALAAVAVPIALTALSWDTLMDVRNAIDAAGADEALADAARLIAINAAVATIGSAAVAVALRGRRLSEATQQRADRAFTALAASLAVVAIAAVALSPGWIDARWDDFHAGYEQVEQADTRLTGELGSGRYDFYRVALNEFRDHPITGIGMENFSVPYIEHRRSGEAPRYPHSLAFSVISQLGIVGAALMLAFLVLALMAFAAVRRRGTVSERGLATAALAGAAMWLVHAQVDWLWEYPALAFLGLTLLAIACRSVGAPGPPERRPRWPLRSVASRAGVALVVLAAAVSLALPAAAARFERSAYDVQREDPETTLSRLERASNLDPLTADPLVARAVFARRLGRLEVTRADLDEAIDREPKNWFAHFELGLLHSEAQNWGEAAASIDTARDLNPRQKLIGEVRKLVAQRKRVDAVSVERALSGQLSLRLRPFDSE